MTFIPLFWALILEHSLSDRYLITILYILHGKDINELFFLKFFLTLTNKIPITDRTSKWVHSFKIVNMIFLT